MIEQVRASRGRRAGSARGPARARAKAAEVVVLALGVGVLVVLAGCGGGGGTVAAPVGGPASPSSAPASSTSAPDPAPATTTESTGPSVHPSTRAARTTSASAAPVTGRTGPPRNETGTVTMMSFDVAARSAVVRRTDMMSGADYCLRMRLPATDDQCADEFRLVDLEGGATYPVRISPAATFFSDRLPDDSDLCREAGGCRVTGAVFAQRVASGNELVKVTVRNALVVRAEQIYHP